MTPEGKIKASITALLKTYGDDVWYSMPVPTGYGIPALDYMGFARGRGFAVEAKRPGGKPTARQELTIDSMRKAGAKVFVVNSYDALEELKLWLTTVVKDHVHNR